MRDWLSKSSSAQAASKAFGFTAVVLLLIVLVSGAIYRSRHSSADDELTTVQRLLDAGRYADAEQRALALKTALGGSSSEDLRLARVLDLLVQALVQNGKAGEADTLALGERLLQLKEDLGADDADLAQSWTVLGSLHLARGEYALAVPEFEHALALRKSKLGDGHPTVADSFNQLATALIRVERFPEARKYVEASQAVQAAARAAPLAQARTLEVLALLNRYEGNYATALESIERSLKLRREFASEHPDIASGLHIRGDVLWLQGDIKAARQSWTDSVSLADRTLGPHHPALAFVLRKLALAAQATGELAEGRRLRERALTIAEPALAPCHPERPNLLSDLAMSLMYDGEYIEAQRKYELALSLYKRCLGERHSLTATALYNQADLAYKMGDLGAAERLYQTAIDLWSGTLGNDHPYVARAIDGLAEVCAKRSQFERAETLYERALAIRRKAVGPNHPDVAWTLTNLARTLVASGNIEQAFQHVETAVDIYRRAGASDEPDHLARALELRSTVEARLGRTAAAMTTLREVLDIRARTFGRSHPLVASSLVQLGRVEFALNQNARALSDALTAEQMGRDHFRFTIRYLPERQALAYAGARPYGLDLALSILSAGPTSGAAPVFDALVRSRGLVLDEMAARAKLLANSNASPTPVSQQLHSARQRFANLVLRSLQADETVSSALLDDARYQKEQAERAVAEQSVTERTELTDTTVGLSDVQRALPADAALVSFVRYFRSPSSLDATGFREASTPAYLVFVARAGTDSISAVPLGSAENIDRLIADWRSMVTRLRPEGDSRKAGQRLRERLWDPLAREIKGASRVFIVPDGEVNLVNFAALPGGEGQYLVEGSLLFHHLSTEKDLISSAPTRTSRTLLAVGGPAFDEPLRAAVESNATASFDGRDATGATKVGVIRGTTCKSLDFQPLAGTAAEVQEIARLWSSLRGTPAAVLTGKAASESAIRAAAVGREIVHFATHGFFLASGCNPAAVGTRAVGGLATDRSNPVGSENPLSLAGLAFAGANRHGASREGDDDGILTGEEVVGMDLRGTRWAVLSACDTGIGEVKAGEGVFGLRRAFQIAGARTVIMSLWSVEDEATREWMRFLYEARLRNSFDTSQALRAAGVSVLRNRRARGLTTHPFYWAAFVAAGDWR